MTARHGFSRQLNRARYRGAVRCCAVWFFLASYLVVATGVPLPVRAPVSLGTERFPCMHGTCGCRTAEQCWRSCCCMTLSQRLAWAKANGVTPPADILAMAKRMADDEKSAEPSKSGAAGTPGVAASCCSQRKAAVQAACCSTKQGGHSVGTCTTGHCDAPELTTDVKEHQASQLVLIDALKCRGLAFAWSGGLVAVLIVIQPFEYSLATICRLGPVRSISYSAGATAPTTPPPEAVASI